MAVIRRAEYDGMARKGVRIDLGDVVRQGEALKRIAEERAEAVLEKAREDRERIMDGAHETGHAEGFANGREAGLAEGREAGKAEAMNEWGEKLAHLEAGWAGAMEAFLSAREQALLEARQDVLRLAVMLAEKVVKRSIASDPDSVVDQAEAVLGLVAAKTTLKLHVCASDMEALRAALPALLSKCSAGVHAELVEDASLAPGSVVARSESGGAIDASVNAQLERLAESLLPGESQSLLFGGGEPEPGKPETTEPETEG